MEVSYKKLWKLLIDKDMKKKDLQSAAGISWSSVTKLSKGETVSMEVLMNMVLNFESGDKAGQDVKYNLTMCLNNGWIEVVD